jgi:ankyrin repeat protein
LTRDDHEALAQLARAGRTPQLLAALGDRGADLADGKGDSLLLLAAYHGHAEMVRALLSAGADPGRRNVRGLSPLDGAAFKGEIAVIEALLEGGADPSVAGPDGRTPLMWAAAFDRLEAARVLLAWGVPAEQADQTGLTARELAQLSGARRVAALLVHAGGAP